LQKKGILATWSEIEAKGLQTLLIVQMGMAVMVFVVMRVQQRMVDKISIGGAKV
jgi:hypothetical protein